MNFDFKKLFDLMEKTLDGVDKAIARLVGMPTEMLLRIAVELYREGAATEPEYPRMGRVLFQAVSSFIVARFCDVETNGDEVWPDEI